MVHWFLPQSVKIKYLVFFLQCPCIIFMSWVPPALQENNLVPQLTQPAIATGQPALLGLYQLCRLLLGHLPQVACAFYLSRRC